LLKKDTRKDVRENNAEKRCIKPLKTNRKGGDVVKKPLFITAERASIARVSKIHVENPIDELRLGYTVDLQGDFYATPIRITIEIFRM